MNKILIWSLGILVLIILSVFVFFILATDNESVILGDSNFDCDSNTYNCEDFQTQSEAQEVFDECGGINNDIHALDRDGNGLACEDLQSSLK